MTPPIRMVSVPVAALDALKHCAENEKAHWSLSGETEACVDVPVKDLRAITDALTAAPVREEGGAVDVGREAIWKLVHEVWQLLDEAETDSAGITTPDQERWQAVSDAMDALEALVPDSAGPFWGGFPVNYFWPALATREEAPAEAGEDDGLFLLMKRGLYYRPNAMGYTGIKDHAGRYTKAEAENHADPISGVTAIAAIDAPDFSPACFDDLARAHLVGKLERATRELSALRAPPPAREDAQPVGWLRAVDEEMVCAHLGVADAEDSFETAKKKLASLIQWNIAVATDPSVGGRPAPDALRVAVEALETINHIRSEMVGVPVDSEAANAWALALDAAADHARQALAALQAEQEAK